MLVANRMFAVNKAGMLIQRGDVNGASHSH
jgi:hypothetical protein